MTSLLTKLWVTTVFSGFVIYFYYFIFSFHNESFWGSYMFYLLLLCIWYWLYKFFYIQFSDEKYTFSPAILISLFFWHLFILCVFFFSLNNLPLWYSMVLLFNIILYSLLPIFLFFISHSFWERILSFIKEFKSENTIFQVIASTWVWFFAFITILTILSFFGQYTISLFLCVILFICVVSYKNIKTNFLNLFWIRWETDIHDLNWNSLFKLINPYLLSSEFLFIVISALISVNLINIVRPFPIWWDDLWVYMNYANLIGSSWKMQFFWQMSSWQVFTWIWYMLWSSTQAFFLNSYSWIISLLTIVFSTKYFLWISEEENTILGFQRKVKHFLNIPLLVWAIYIALPMVIFHLAKDMKLDQWLLFISVFSVFIIYYLLISKEKRTVKNILTYLFIAWVISGFAFSIKLTTLLLISAIIWVLWFSELGVIWFLWYVSIFFAVFTKFHLWDLLNVVYPKNDTFMINTISWFLWGLWIACLSIAIKKEWIDSFKKWVLYVLIFCLWIITALSPWLFWNISWSNNYNLGYIINWKTESYIPKYELIRGKEFVEKKLGESSMTTSGQTLNEDYGRYFWYDSWINNYLKIFWNISLQVNQKWEFTDISYIFFALMPSLLLFLPLKRKIYEYTLYACLIVSVLFFMILVPSSALTWFFSTINLPFGYLIIILPYVWMVWFTLYWIDLSKSKLLKVFSFNMITLSFYVFLWEISAFWIVWYGITMYFFFLLLMAISLNFISQYTWDEKEVENKAKALSTYIIFWIISIYFIFSSYPHLLINLQTAGYTEFKVGTVNEKESIFLSHTEYLDFLYELNIDSDKKWEFLDSLKSNFVNDLKNVSNSNELVNIVESTNNIKIFEKVLTSIIWSQEITDIQIKNYARKARNSLYKWLVYPEERFKSNNIIYRAGTFMKYFITDNHKRVFEDNLLDWFDQYIYDEDSTLTAERLKKLWVKQILLDLNAATIDNDPRKNLTKRYEHVLSFLSSDQVEYVSWDSICFSIALDSYKKSKKEATDLADFILLAWINYDSVLKDWKVASRNQKLANCFYKIKDLVTKNLVTNESPEWLKSIYSYVKNPDNNIKTDDDWMNVIGRSLNPWFKVLFKVK